MPIGPGPHTAPALRASANWIELGQGTYCISHAIGSTAPDPSTGMPAVRLSRAPNAGAALVTLVGLAEDGWVGPPGSAMLVQVHADSTRLLMTIYQQADAEAPKLLITRLGDEGGTTVAADIDRPAEAGDPEPEVVAHVQNRGDVAGELGSWAGERGGGRAIEGFALTPRRQGLSAADIEYQAVLGPDWRSPWIEGGQRAGSRGLALPILGLNVRLRGERAATHTLTVAATFVDGSVVGQTGPDTPCQAESLAPLEAFCVTIVPKAGA